VRAQVMTAPALIHLIRETGLGKRGSPIVLATSRSFLLTSSSNRSVWYTVWDIAARISYVPCNAISQRWISGSWAMLSGRLAVWLWLGLRQGLCLGAEVREVPLQLSFEPTSNDTCSCHGDVQMGGRLR